MNLLIYFAFPIATIIISIILQKLIKNPVLVAAFIFAIFLIITFAVYDETFLIATLIYTIISLITAFIVCVVCNNEENNNCVCNTISDLLSNSENNIEENGCGCGNNNNNGFGCRFRRR